MRKQIKYKSGYRYQVVEDYHHEGSTGNSSKDRRNRLNRSLAKRRDSAHRN